MTLLEEMHAAGVPSAARQNAVAGIIKYELLGPRGDPLDRMIAAQAVFQERMPASNSVKREATLEDPWTEKMVHGRTRQLMENTLMLAKEAFEAHDEVPWKMHKQEYGREMTPDELTATAKELVDCLHFLINSFILCGLETAEQIEEAFFDKNAVNHQRQDSGY